MAIKESRNAREYDKFEEMGSAVSQSVPTSTTAIKTQLFGVTAGGTGLPIKIVDDGSGRGKLVTVPE